MIKIKDIIHENKYHVFKIYNKDELRRFLNRLYQEDLYFADFKPHEIPAVYNTIVSSHGSANISIINDDFHNELLENGRKIVTNHIMNEYGEFIKEDIEVYPDIKKVYFVSDNTKIPIFSDSVITDDKIIYNTQSTLFPSVINYLG